MTAACPQVATRQRIQADQSPSPTRRNKVPTPSAPLAERASSSAHRLRVWVRESGGAVVGARLGRAPDVDLVAVAQPRLPDAQVARVRHALARGERLLARDEPQLLGQLRYGLGGGAAEAARRLALADEREIHRLGRLAARNVFTAA
eukprot:1522713-Pleurochrysis_carterae.AAC.2